MENKFKVDIPLSVPKNKINEYINNYLAATKNSKKLFLFAGDQKIEHLNKDFYGKGIDKQDADPEHLFKIANKAPVGAFATQLGLISKYGNDYPKINYVIKLNSKTDIVSLDQMEPISALLNSVDDVIKLKKNSELSIVGVGFTIYLGSKNEHIMLSQASQIIFNAHQNGLLAILWIYPRGKAVKKENDTNIIAGACGVAASLGADFVKVNPPKNNLSKTSAQLLKQSTLAAGRTKVICSGGKKIEEEKFLKNLYDQIHIGKTFGCAVGRNIHQKNLNDAVNFCKAISAIVHCDLSITQAKKHL